MARPLLMVFLASLLIVFAEVALADSARTNLIPARPQYMEAAHVPSGDLKKTQFNPPAPTPSEQLYVFWILGKLISYPVDAMESYVASLREQWRAKPVPAAASSAPNPFEERRFGQVPPAPPVVLGPRGR